MSEPISVTDEHDAGATSIDGETLTLELLHENRLLLASNKRLKYENERGFRMFYGLLVFVVVYALGHSMGLLP